MSEGRGAEAPGEPKGRKEILGAGGARGWARGTAEPAVGSERSSVDRQRRGRGE